MDTCRQLVLVGDHRQLPPTIQSYKAKQEGLDESLFERFIRLGYPFTMMDIQFRMHPAIAEFPAAQWYVLFYPTQRAAVCPNHRSKSPCGFPPFLDHNISKAASNRPTLGEEGDTRSSPSS